MIFLVLDLKKKQKKQNKENRLIFLVLDFS